MCMGVASSWLALSLRWIFKIISLCGDGLPHLLTLESDKWFSFPFVVQSDTAMDTDEGEKEVPAKKAKTDPVLVKQWNIFISP